MSAMDYLQKRRHNLNKVKVEEAFATLVKFYTLEWLERANGHAIQILWSRKDFIATNELYALGRSLLKLSQIDLHWTRTQVKLSKTTDKNNSQGALFEIFGLSLFETKGQSVKPAFLNQAGYDGTIHCPNGKQIRLSIKNYSISRAQAIFEEKAKETEGLISFY